MVGLRKSNVHYLSFNSFIGLFRFEYFNITKELNFFEGFANDLLQKYILKMLLYILYTYCTFI